MGDSLLSLSWALFTKYLVPLIPGAAGSLLALLFMNKGMARIEKVTGFFGGLACAYFIAPALVEYFQIEGHQTQSAISFLIGVFGLATARELAKEIQELRLLQSLRDRFIGKKPDAS